MLIIHVKIDGRIVKAGRLPYVRKKLKWLQEFGYSGLKKEEVEKAVDAALKGEAKTDVISMLVADEVQPTAANEGTDATSAVQS